MFHLNSRRAFTLIELMIAIAILAILSAIPLITWQSLGDLTREKNYRFAVASADLIRDQVLEVPYNLLPPRVLTVDQEGVVALGWVAMVEDSLTLRWPDGSPAVGRSRFVDDRLQVPPEWAGRELVVDYRFVPDYLPNQGDAYTVPTEAPYEVELHNAPVEAISRVWLAQGKTLTPLSPEAYELLEERRLRVPGDYAGRVLVVEYRGRSIRTEVGGSFLDSTLEPQLAPSQLKKIELKTNYGGRRRLATGFLRVGP